jgi:riboflavin synthase
MFTGIIQDIGEITAIDKTRGDVRFWIKTSLTLDDKAIGASIACSGCCLTVVEKRAQEFAVDVSAESISKTCFGDYEVGGKLNIEPSMRIGDEIGGHLVSGHVDGLVKIMSIEPDGDSHRLEIEMPKAFAPYLAAKGSVALDGISLTVNTVDDERGVFGINIIPHTWDVTTLGKRKTGDMLHLEIDQMARYAARILAVSSKAEA